MINTNVGGYRYFTKERFTLRETLLFKVIALANHIYFHIIMAWVCVF